MLMCGRSVVVATAADGVSHPSHRHQQQADDKEQGPDDQANMGVSESRDESRKEESKHNKDNSEHDHGVHLVFSIRMSEIKITEIEIRGLLPSRASRHRAVAEMMFSGFFSEFFCSTLLISPPGHRCLRFTCEMRFTRKGIFANMFTSSNAGFPPFLGAWRSNSATFGQRWPGFGREV
jgi:hypothetical protein